MGARYVVLSFLSLLLIPCGRANLSYLHEQLKSTPYDLVSGSYPWAYQGHYKFPLSAFAFRRLSMSSFDSFFLTLAHEIAFDGPGTSKWRHCPYTYSTSSRYRSWMGRNSLMQSLISSLTLLRQWRWIYRLWRAVEAGVRGLEGGSTGLGQALSLGRWGCSLVVLDLGLLIG